jgi:hypothetical protein
LAVLVCCTYNKNLAAKAPGFSQVSLLTQTTRQNSFASLLRQKARMPEAATPLGAQPLRRYDLLHLYFSRHNINRSGRLQIDSWSGLRHPRTSRQIIYSIKGELFKLPAGLDLTALGFQFKGDCSITRDQVDHIGRLFTSVLLTVFLKLKKYPKFLAAFFRGKGYVCHTYLLFNKNGLCCVLGDLFHKLIWLHCPGSTLGSYFPTIFGLKFSNLTQSMFLRKNPGSKL